MDIKRYLETELNRLETEKTMHEGKLEEINRQVSLYEQLIATYEKVETEVKQIEEEKDELRCSECEHNSKSIKQMPCKICHKHNKWEPKVEEKKVIKEIDEPMFMPKEEPQKLDIKKPEEVVKKTTGIFAKGTTQYTLPIMKAIESYGEPMTATEIATVLNTTASHIHGGLQILVKNKLLTKDTDKKYDIRKKVE